MPKPQEDRIALYIREHIRTAREEKHISQEELAKYLEKSRVAVSDLERGRVQVSASDLATIAAVLDKPITYFFPEWAMLKMEPENLTTEQHELLIQARRLRKDDLQRLTAQARALAELADQQYEQEISEKVEQLKAENPDLTTEEIAARILEFRADRSTQRKVR